MATIFPSSVFICLFTQSLPVRKRSLEGRPLGLFPLLIPCRQVAETLPSSPLSRILSVPVRGAARREPNLLPFLPQRCRLMERQGTKPNQVARAHFAIAGLRQHPQESCWERSRAPGATRGSSVPLTSRTQ